MEQSASSKSIIGTVVDNKYRIESLLGQGGMGKVFRVSHQFLNKIFALKIMDFGSAGQHSNRLSRFRREAEALARINHPNVVMVTDYGVMLDDVPYIVMEYIEGITLRRLLDNQLKLSERQTIHIAKQICAALHEAHRRGVVHRDLKPENIMIQQFDDGDIMARVLDFGIAKLMQQTDDSLTGPNIPGTIKYMAPEQIFNSLIDVRSDIFSLCLVIYEALTGIVPGAQLGKVSMLHEVRADISLQLSGLVNRGLAIFPDDRPKSVLELKRELENLEFSGQSPLDKVITETDVFAETTNKQGETSKESSFSLEHLYNLSPFVFDIEEDAVPDQIEKVPSEVATPVVVAVSAQSNDSVEVTDETLREAISDFDLFLSGKRAPALVGQSLATVIRLPIPRVVKIVMSWAKRRSGLPLIDA
ncbi:MAG: serine/threonine-protein kinase, partial [Acidobacteriota bacterium]